MRKKPKIVLTDYVAVPMEIRKRLNKITLTGDVMFINKLLFFMTYGWDIGLITVEFTSCRTAKQWQKIWHM